MSLIKRSRVPGMTFKLSMFNNSISDTSNALATLINVVILGLMTPLSTFDKVFISLFIKTANSAWLSFLSFLMRLIFRPKFVKKAAFSFNSCVLFVIKSAIYIPFLVTDKYTYFMNV